MKRPAAIVLSLILIWIQAVAAVRTTSAAPPAMCGCCACKKMECCVAQSTPGSQPLPAAPAPVPAQQQHYSAVLSVLAAWVLPAAPSQISSSDNAPLLALSVPIFTRHCALLI